MIVFWTDAGRREVDEVVGPAAKRIKPSPSIGYSPLTGEIVYPGAGHVVVVMGKRAMQMLEMKGIVPKNRTVSGMREKAIKHGDGWWLITHHPDYTAVEASALDDIHWDVRLADRLVRTGTTAPKYGNYGYVLSLKEYLLDQAKTMGEAGHGIIATFDKSKGGPDGSAPFLPATPTEVGVDLETIGTDPYAKWARIVSVQVSVQPGEAGVVYLRDLTPQQQLRLKVELAELLNSPSFSVRGANFKFDLNWLWVHWRITCSNFKFDTLLVGSLLNENRSNSLKTHAKVYTDMGGYEDSFTMDKGRMDLVPKAMLLPYAGGDADVTLQSARAMRAELKHFPRLQRFYVKLLHRGARAFERIEQRGVVVDLPRYKALQIELAKESEQHEAKALSLLPGRLRARHANDLRISRPQITKDFLFTPLGLNLKPIMRTEKTGEPSTSKDHFNMFLDHPEARAYIEAYVLWAQAEKTKSTFVDGFLQYLRPDGLFHPSYMLFAGSMFGGKGDDSGTNTGRTSAKEPAMQTLPKHNPILAPRLRRCFTAPKGMVCWECDFSQGELRVTACVANEEKMIAAYRNKEDLHKKTAIALNNLSEEEVAKMDKATLKALRQGGKAGNFGLIYGMGAEGYQDFAFKSYQVSLTPQQAEFQRDKFFETYPGLTAWHNRSIGFAEMHRAIESPLGRIRHLPLIRSRDRFTASHARRQAINSPVQSCLSDMCILAIALLSERYPDLWIAGMTHDSAYGFIPEKQAEAWLRRIRDTMSDLPLHEFGWEPQLPFPVDGSLGINMAELEEVSF